MYLSKLKIPLSFEESQNTFERPIHRALMEIIMGQMHLPVIFGVLLIGLSIFNAPRREYALAFVVLFVALVIVPLIFAIVFVSHVIKITFNWERETFTVVKKRIGFKPIQKSYSANQIQNIGWSDSSGIRLSIKKVGIGIPYLPSWLTLTDTRETISLPQMSSWSDNPMSCEEFAHAIANSLDIPREMVSYFDDGGGGG
jgi:hypothetical protein